MLDGAIEATDVTAATPARARATAFPMLWQYIHEGELTRATRLALLTLERAEEPLVRAEMHGALGTVRLRVGNIAEARDAFERAASLTTAQDPGHAGYVVQAAMCRFLVGDLAGAVRQALRAQHEGRRSGDGFAICEAFNVRALVALAEGRPHQALELAEAALAVRHQAPATGGGPACHLYAGLALAELDRLAEGAATLEEGLAIARQEGSTTQAPWYEGFLALLAFVEGRWSDAEAYAEDAVRDAEEYGVLIARPIPNAIRALVASSRGDVSLARTILETTSLEQLFGVMPGDLNFLALSSVAEDAETAHEHLLDGWLHSRRAPYFLSWRVLVPLLCASARHFGDDALAHEALAAAEEGARRAPGVPSARAAALRCRATVESDPVAARQAIEEYRRAGRPSSLAHACLDLAGVIADCGEWIEAMELLQEASDIFHSLRATAWNADVGRELARIATVARRTPPPPEGWERLTRGEREIALLVGQGLTNPEIAARLVVSPRTVQTHTSHIYAKLGITSRVQLASMLPTPEA